MPTDGLNPDVGGKAAWKDTRLVGKPLKPTAYKSHRVREAGIKPGPSLPQFHFVA